MQALLQNKIAENIRDSITVQRISDGLYTALSNHNFFAVQNRETVSSFSNEEISLVSYSSNDTIADIVDKVQKQDVIQKYHCTECAIAMMVELFTHYSIDAIMKCCGIMIFYNGLPILRLTNDDGPDNRLIVTMDLSYIEKVINSKSRQVAGIVEASLQDSIKSQPTSSNIATYTLAGITIGMFLLLVFNELRN